MKSLDLFVRTQICKRRVLKQTEFCFSVVLLYSWILLVFVSTYNVAFMDYRNLLSTCMLKYKYCYAVTGWLRNYEQIPIIIVIYKLCCIFWNVFLNNTCSPWSVNVQLNLFTSFFTHGNRTYLYVRFSTCCRIRESVISTIIIVLNTTLWHTPHTCFRNAPSFDNTK